MGIDPKRVVFRDGRYVVLGTPANGRPLGGMRFRQSGADSSGFGADAAYDAIRASTTDIDAIAKNSGLPQSYIRRVKNHVFHEEHLLDRYVDYGVPAEMRRF